MSGNLIQDRREYPLGGATSANVELEILHGPLSVGGGASDLCEAEFEYSHPELRPIDDFRQDGDRASLEVRQPRTDELRDPRNAWSVAFNSDVQIELAISAMSGSVALDLDQVQVSNVEVKSRSGSVQASLAGSYPELDELVIDSMSGRVAMSLTGEFPQLSLIEVDSKSGSTDLAVTGSFPELRRIDIDSKSGNVSLDLRGAFQRDDLGVRVDSISGGVRIRVPAEIGVSLQASTISGRVQASGFSNSNGRLTNDAFGSSAATIWLNVHVTSGSVDVLSG